MAEAQIIARSRPARSFDLGRFLLTALAVLIWLVAVAVVGIIFAYQYNYQGRIFEGVSVRGIDLSGATLREAETRLKAAFDPYPLAAVTVRYGDQTWTLTAEDLGVDFSARRAAEAAYLVGRSKPAGSSQLTPTGVPTPLIEGLNRARAVQFNLQEQIAAYRNGHEVLALETIDQMAGLNWLNQRAQEINRPVIEASLRLEGTDVITTASQVGLALDVAASHQAIYDALLANQGATVDLVIRQTRPLLADVDQAEAFLRQVLAGPVTLTAPDPDLDSAAPPPSYVIDVSELISLVSLKIVEEADGSLRLEAELDPQPLRPLVQRWAADLAREPRDARLDFEPSTGDIQVMSPSQIGRVLDVNATLAAIRQGATSDQRQVDLPLRLVEPGVNMHRIAEMGIVELVAQGVSNFSGSSPDRIHNIATAAAAVHGIVVPPGSVFSFNNAIGDVSAENGYKDSLIIWGDRTAVGIGGGVCQVSTTVFRAAYYGGLPILERYNHGYIVGWYGQPGLDATIYTPTIDFKFRNNTDHHLLIEAEMDERRGVLTFNFYGTKPDWQVEVTGPNILSEQPPTRPVYQEDASLAIGQIKQVEWANKGMEVVWRRVITDSAGETIADETLRSSYVPWPAYYLVGPGTEVPDGVDFRPLAQSRSGG